MSEKAKYEQIADDLRAVRKRLKHAPSIEALTSAIYTFEMVYSCPADGVWLITEQGRSQSKFAELADIETVDIKRLAALESLRIEMAVALSAAIEATKREMPNGKTWWTYAPHDVIRAMFKAMLENEK